MANDLTSTVNGVKYCMFCMAELGEDQEVCTCKATQKALAKAKQKAEKANLPKHNNDRPPRKTDK